MSEKKTKVRDLVRPYKITLDEDGIDELKECISEITRIINETNQIKLDTSQIQQKETKLVNASKRCIELVELIRAFRIDLKEMQASSYWRDIGDGEMCKHIPHATILYHYNQLRMLISGHIFICMNYNGIISVRIENVCRGWELSRRLRDTAEDVLIKKQLHNQDEIYINIVSCKLPITDLFEPYIGRSRLMEMVQKQYDAYKPEEFSEMTDSPRLNDKIGNEYFNEIRMRFAHDHPKASYYILEMIRHWYKCIYVKDAEYAGPYEYNHDYRTHLPNIYSMFEEEEENLLDDSEP